MEKLLLVAALACLPGDLLIDLRSVPRTVLRAVLHLPARLPGHHSTMLQQQVYGGSSDGLKRRSVSGGKAA